MTELKSALEAFGRGDASFETLSQAFDRFLGQHPEQAASVQKLLKKAREKGLPHHVFVALNAKVDGILRPRDPDATVMAGAETTSASSQDADATQISGSADATVADVIGDDSQTSAAAADPDATMISGGDGAADDDRTAIHAPDADATVVTADDATVATGGAGGTDFDIFGPADNDTGANTGNTSQTGASWPTTGNLTTASGPRAGVDKDFGPNDVLRGRFLLLNKLGEGGMGAVWKAKDLLKEEARDRNPFVAIKMLQGDFKSHPEAFIALQRETAKQQRLAHPNIATVYDFDRDMETGTVYMTMEVMEGAPMDSYIRKMPKDGLPYDEAMNLIEQLGAGLEYAHAAKLVHSDLKPGNAFFTNDGVVKLLDFGIARASKTKGDAEGETTLFDPGKLGALTPTYATIEMFEGMDPDPRDDIYAMAIMAYQFFSSRHPFNKKSAPKAKELGLTVEPLEKLTKRQNKELARGLAFFREDRTPTVEEFLEGLRPHKSNAGRNSAIAAVVIAGLVGGLYAPVTNYIKEQEREEIITQIQQGDIANISEGLDLTSALEDEEQRNKILDDQRTRDAIIALFAQGTEKSINNGLKLIAPLQKNTQNEILDADDARKAIFGFFESRRDAVLDPANGKYDYPAAEKIIKKLANIYQDSARVFKLQNDLESQKQSELSELSDSYSQLLAEGQLLPSEADQDIGDILKIVRQIDPENELLKDRQLPIRFADVAQEAIDAKDFNRAKQFLDASVAYAPDDATLNGLRYEVESELKRQRDQILVAQLEKRLTARKSSLKTLADFQGIRDDLIKLAELSPSNKVLTDLQSSLKKAFGRQLGKDIKGKKFANAETLLVNFAKFMELGYVMDQRSALTAAEKKAGFEQKQTAELTAAINERTGALDKLLAKPELAGDWESRVKQNYKELLALAAEANGSVKSARDGIAQVYLNGAAKSREAGRFTEALALVDKGRAFDADAPGFDVEREAIAAAQEALRKKQAEERRLARLETLKRELKTKANATQPKEAADILAELRKGLPPDDVFIKTEGPDLIAQAYLRQAAQMEEREDWKNALALAKAAQQYAPTLPGLKEKLDVYVSAYEKDKKIIDFRTALSAWPIKESVSALTKQLADIKASLPERFSKEQTKWANILAQRVRAQGVSDPKKVAALAKPFAVLNALFPNTYKRESDRASKGIRTRLKSLEGKKAYKAHGDLLAAARKALPRDKPIADTQVFTPPKASKIAARAREEIKAGKLTAAKNSLSEAQKKTPRAPNIPPAQNELNKRMQLANADWTNYQRYVKARQEKTGRPYCTRALQYWADNPNWKCGGAAAPPPGGRNACVARKAGLGRSSRADCYDLVGGKAKGPKMVVVPAGGGHGTPYAIGKYEVSIGDFNRYCKATKKCSAKRGNKDLPVTGISFATAQAYTKWLSKVTKKNYHIPTEAEWEHAAKAGGKQPKKDWNCRVSLGNQIIKGHSLISAKSGKQNGWGLANYVGNAQEWVKAGGGVKARGGAFSDPLSKCEISVAKSHSGNADEETGFRVVRNL